MFVGQFPSRRRRGLDAVLFCGIALAAMSSAARAETLTVTDLEVPGSELFQVTVPSITIVDGNLTEAQVRGIFAGDTDVIATLGSLSATRIEIPELSVVQNLPETPTGTGYDELSFTNSTTTYRDFVISDVVDGVAAESVIGSTEVYGDDKSLGVFDQLVMSDLNIGQVLAFYGLVPPEGYEELREVYSSFTFDGGEIDYGVFACQIGGMSSGSFSARAPATSFSELFEVISELEAEPDSEAPPSPEAVSTLVNFYLDFITAFRSDPISFDGFDCEGGEDGDRFTVGGGPIYSDAYEPGFYPATGMDAFEIDMGDKGGLEMGNFVWKAMDLTGPIEALRSASVLDEAWFIANWRKLVPAMDGFSLSGLVFDFVADDGTPPVSGALDSMDLTLGSWINGVPSDIAFSVENLDTEVPPPGGDTPDFRALGIERLILDFATHLRWDKGTESIVFEELLLDVDQLGRVAIAGTLGNATPALFGDDMQAAETAAMSLTVKSLDLKVTDYGLGGIVTAIGAQEAGQPPEGFRTALAGMVQGMTLAFLGNSEESLRAAIGIGNFLGGSPELHLTITANDPAGIGMADLAALESNPAALAGRVTITAEASGDPLPVPELPAPGAAPDATPPESGVDGTPSLELDSSGDATPPAGSIQNEKRDLKLAPAQ